MKNKILKIFNVTFLLSEIYKWTYFLNLWEYDNVDYPWYVGTLLWAIFFQLIMLIFLSVYLHKNKTEIAKGTLISIKICRVVAIFMGVVIVLRCSSQF